MRLITQTAEVAGHDRQVTTQAVSYFTGCLPFSTPLLEKAFLDEAHVSELPGLLLGSKPLRDTLAHGSHGS